MSFRPLFEFVGEFPSSIAIRESLNGYTYLLTAHVLGMCLFAGLVAMMDVRLAGIGNLGTPVTQIQKRLFPWQVLGIFVSFSTGLTLLYADPMRYFTNFYFWLKMILLVVATVNLLWFHFTTYSSVAQWDNDPAPPFAARLAGYFSLALWGAIIFVGRMEAYSGLVPQWWVDLKIGA
ncbi:MAG: hypothetical protein AB7O32_09880 [Vicinamibacterales bacterium]